MISKVLEENGIEPESYEDFVYRLHLTEQLQKADEGVIFIGNSRSGKSTLFSGMAGSLLKIVYDKPTKITYLLPEGKFKQFVKVNFKSSHTEIPNVELVNDGGRKFLYVDMPGHADSSPFRELINFFYIKAMTQNLKKMSFLMVILISQTENEYKLEEKQIKMMTSFMAMFKNCSQHINIIVNKVEQTMNEQLQSNIKEAVRDAIIKNENSQFRKYYESISVDKIHIVTRPLYKKLNQLQHFEIPHKIKILPKYINYIQMRQIKYDKPILFDKANSAGKDLFEKQIKGYLAQSFEQLKLIYEFVKKIINLSIISIAKYEPQEIRREKLKQALSTYNQTKRKCINADIELTFPKNSIHHSSCIDILIVRQLTLIMKSNDPAQQLKIVSTKEKYERFAQSLIEHILVCQDIMRLDPIIKLEENIMSSLKSLLLTAHRKYKQIIFIQESISSLQNSSFQKYIDELFNDKILRILFNLNQNKEIKVQSKEYWILLNTFFTQIISKPLPKLQSKQQHDQVIEMYTNLIQLVKTYGLIEKGYQATGKVYNEQQWVKNIKTKLASMQCLYLLDSIGENYYQYQAKILQTLQDYEPNDNNKEKLTERLAYMNSSSYIHNPKAQIKLYLLLKRYDQAFQIIISEGNDLSYEFLLEFGDEFAEDLRDQKARQCYEKARKLDYYNFEHLMKAEKKILDIELKKVERVKKRQEKLNAVKGRADYIEFGKINDIRKYVSFKERENPQDRSTKKIPLSPRSPRIKQPPVRQTFCFTK